MDLNKKYNWADDFRIDTILKVKKENNCKKVKYVLDIPAHIGTFENELFYDVVIDKGIRLIDKILSSSLLTIIIFLFVAIWFVFEINLMMNISNSIVLLVAGIIWGFVFYTLYYLRLNLLSDIVDKWC